MRPHALKRPYALLVASLTLAALGSTSLFAGQSRPDDKTRGAANGPKVLFDVAHHQAFRPDKDGPLQLGKLSERFDSQGAPLTLNGTRFSDDALAGVTGVFISGPFAAIGPEEVAALERFVQRGGRLAVALHIGPTAAGLLSSFGVSISNGAIRDAARSVDGDPLNFRTASLAAHPVMDGIEAFAVYGCWALLPRSGPVRAAASTSPGAWVDLNRDGKFGEGDARQRFDVAVAGTRGEGAFVFLGDDAIFQNRFLTGDNLTLADNLAGWLAGKR